MKLWYRSQTAISILRIRYSAVRLKIDSTKKLELKCLTCLDVALDELAGHLKVWRHIRLPHWPTWTTCCTTASRWPLIEAFANQLLHFRFVGRDVLNRCTMLEGGLCGCPCWKGVDWIHGRKILRFLKEKNKNGLRPV